MNPIRQLFGQTAIYGLGTVIPRLVNYLLLTPFYTRIFNLGEYGVVTEFYAYVVFLMVLLTYGMETGYFRYAGNGRNPDEVFSTSLISLFTTSSTFILLIWMFAKPIATAVGYPDHEEYFIWMSLIVGMDAFMAIPFARLRLNNKATKFAFIKIVNVLVNVLMNFLFLYLIPALDEQHKGKLLMHIYSPEIGVGYVFISNLAASIITLVLLSGELIKISLRFNSRLLKEMLIYSLPLLLSGFAGTVNEALDRILIKNLVGGGLDPLEQLGIYGANYKIAVFMQLFIQMFRYAAEPFYFNKVNDKNAKIIFADVMKYFTIACLLLFLIITLYLDIFKYFIGREYHVGLKIVPIILMSIFIMGIFVNLSIWYKLTNRTIYGAFITIVGAIITFMVNWLFIPKFGYVAAAWAHVLCYLVMVIISYILGRKYFNIPYNVKTILLFTGIALILYEAANQIHIENFTWKMILNTGLIIVFIIAVGIIERKKINEILSGYENKNSKQIKT